MSTQAQRDAAERTLREQRDLARGYPTMNPDLNPNKKIDAKKRSKLALAEELDGVSALGRDGGDGLAHVAGADDGEV